MSGGSNGQGAFPLCKAAAEAKTPLCLPKDGSILNPGITYYGKLFDAHSVTIQKKHTYQGHSTDNKTAPIQ